MLQNNIRIIIILCLISCLGRFVLDSYLPSLPAIGYQFGIPSSSTQYTLTVYLLGFSISQLFYGPLSDRHGRRIIILFGMFIFFIGNFICSIATTPTILIMSRLLAGVGAGACGVLNRAIAGDCFKGADFSKAWSYTTTTLVLSLIFAPVLGGYIQEQFGWRGNFILATILVAAVFFIIAKFLPETHKQFAESSLKVRNVLFNYYQFLTSRTFIMGTLCYTLAFSGLIIYFQVSPLLYIRVFGLSPSQYGWSSIVIAVSYLTGGLFVNKFAHKVGVRNLLFIGTILLICGGILMLLAYAMTDKSLIAVLLPSAIYVIGARIVIPNALSASMGEFNNKGSSSALIGCIQMLGSSLISLFIANFSATTPLPLGVFFTCLGLISLTIVMFIKPTYE